MQTNSCEAKVLFEVVQCNVFMKLFRTGNIEVVRDCQAFFNFDLPSMLLRKRTDRFISNYRNSGNVCNFLCAN